MTSKKSPGVATYSIYFVSQTKATSTPNHGQGNPITGFNTAKENTARHVSSYSIYFVSQTKATSTPNHGQGNPITGFNTAKENTARHVSKCSIYCGSDSAHNAAL